MHRANIVNVFSLEWNSIGDQGATSLAKALEKNETLTSLEYVFF